MNTSLLSPPHDADLSSLLRAYNEATERLKRSHELLRREVVRLREQLEQKDRELQRSERLAALGQMAAGVAHEIRNPLGGIGLYVSLLERDLTDRPKELDIVRRIRTGIDSMERVVGDILAFAGDRSVRQVPFRLGGAVDNVLAHVQPRISLLGVQVCVEDAAREKLVQGDPNQIERALLNLVLNALDAVGRGGTVWLGVGTTADGFLEISVADDGPGIDPASVDRLFNPFFTTKDTGTGLGLAIVHRIAEAHGGRVAARQREGGGARFVLTLPAADAEVRVE